ncbi:MAG TPA: flagellar hook-associated protein FlgK [Bryobacteraceae bacterium]|jgi:flagellar hook-associated protein 1 FlgK
MSSLFAALGTSANALDVLEQAMSVVQNNVANAQTPGYVTQTLQLSAALFDPAHGSAGGVRAGNIQSARNNFAENSVWSANQQLGSATQQATSLDALDKTFDVSGSNGIPGALTTLYSAFSAWSSTPSSTTAQQQVINAAQGVAQAINATAASAETVRSQARQQTQSVISQINQLTSQIASLNGQILSGGQDDAGLQAQLYQNVESLSNLVDISVQPQSNGTVNVLLGGQVGLVTGTSPQAISVKATPAQAIFDSNGSDITEKVHAGQLGGLLQITNNVIPSLLGDATQQGSLNQLAQGIADRVNTLLQNGQTSSGASGTPLFQYTAGTPTTVAQTLGVASGITGSQLAAVDPGPPSVANGIADKLAQLQHPTSAADMINGQSYTDFYSTIASTVGNLASGAAQTQTSQTQLLAQAQNARGQLSGVSLNAQAAALLQYQNAYQASAQAFSTIRNTISYLLQTFQSL